MWRLVAPALIAALLSGGTVRGEVREGALGVATREIIEAFQRGDFRRFEKHLGDRVEILVDTNLSDADPPANHDRVRLRSRAAARRWFDKQTLFDLRFGRVVRCRDDCCSLGLPESRGDVQHYLQQVCFAPDLTVRRMKWED